MMPHSIQSQAGDRVKLKTGSPVMTVTQRIDASTVNTTWCVNDVVEFGTFSLEDLVMASDA
jgi:uncharacterized protein YodC (DUF2158 family)